MWHLRKTNLLYITDQNRHVTCCKLIIREIPIQNHQNISDELYFIINKVSFENQYWTTKSPPQEETTLGGWSCTVLTNTSSLSSCTPEIGIKLITAWRSTWKNCHTFIQYPFDYVNLHGTQELFISSQNNKLSPHKISQRTESEGEWRHKQHQPCSESINISASLASTIAT